MFFFSKNLDHFLVFKTEVVIYLIRTETSSVKQCLLGLIESQFTLRNPKGILMIPKDSKGNQDSLK